MWLQHFSSLSFLALVVVNGAIACEDGRHTGAGAGRMLWFQRE